MITSLTENQTGFKQSALKEFMKGVVQMAIFCQRCHAILDMKTVGHIDAKVDGKSVGSKVLCPKCFKEGTTKIEKLMKTEKRISAEIMNARDLYKKPPSL